MDATPFVGRAEEIRRLRGELDRTTGSGSRIVLITGEPGVGKTRLLAEFRAAVTRRATVLAGRGSPLGSEIPFSVLAEALQAHLRSLPPERVAALAGRWAPTLASIVPAAGSPDAAPPSRLAALEALSALLAALATDRPVVLLLDDVHQADPSTWGFLGYLGRNPLTAPVLVVAATRAEPAPGDPGGATADALRKDGLAVALDLDPLGSEDILALADRILGAGEMDDELGTWLVDRSRGNPLFAVGLLQELALDPTRRVVPVSVKERVRMATLALPAHSRTLLEAAAVLGHSFTMQALAAVAPTEDLSGIDVLVAHGLLAPREDELAFDFVHPLVQEAIDEQTGPERRRSLHARVAADETVPLPVRAYHAARGALPGDASAIAVLRAAARLAEEQQSHREALTSLEAARSLLPPALVADRREVLDEIAWQAANASDHTAGISALDELDTLSGDDALARAGVQIRRASFLATGAGDLAAAERDASAAVALLTNAGADERLAGATNELAWIRGEAGDLTAQVDGARRALALAETAGDEPVAMHALGALASALGLLGHAEESLAVGRRGLALARASGDRSQIGWHTGVVGESLLNAGRPGEAAALLDALLEATPNPSDVAYFSRARVCWHLGRWATVLADCRAVQALHPGVPSVHSVWTASLAGLAATATGRVALAGPLLAQAERAYGGRGFYAFSALHDWAAGCAAWTAGRANEGADRMRAAADRLARMGARPLAAQILPDLVEAAVDAGDRGGARGAADMLAEVAPGDDVSIALGSFGAALVDEDAGALASAASALGLIGFPWHRARALERLGGLTDGQDRIDALTAAARLYATLPQPGAEERVRTALRSIGAKGRRAAQGVGALTTREREVASLARDGMATKDIAARLHLSERTIESHLARVYAKLGIAGRRDLPAHVGP